MLLGAVFLVGGGAALTRFARKADVTAGELAPRFQCRTVRAARAGLRSDHSRHRHSGRALVPVCLTSCGRCWRNGALSNSRAEIVGVLEAIEKLAWSRFGAAFLELAPERRLDVIKVLDGERAGAKDPAYAKFKHLVLVGYYQSEIGATRELRYELVPGAWRSCVPLSEIGRASAV